MPRLAVAAAPAPGLPVRLIAALPSAAVALFVFFSWTLWNCLGAFTLSGGYTVRETFTEHAGRALFRFAEFLIVGWVPLLVAVIATVRVPQAIATRALFWLHAAVVLIGCVMWAFLGTVLTYLLA